MSKSACRCLSSIALAAAIACEPAVADDGVDVKALAKQLEASLKTIDALQHRVEQLESKQAGGTQSNALATRIEAVEHSVAQVEASSAAAAQADTGLPIHGFADVGGGVRNAAAAGTATRGFKVGVFDLYMTPQISSQVKALVEIAFEYGDDGVLGVDVERMQLGYSFSDSLTMWAGRFHTPFGYWNTAFHHGAELQTSIARPRFLDFEDGGGILPAHSVGAWAAGSTHTSLGKVGYDFYIINGDRIQSGILDYQAIGDSDGNVGFGFRSNLALVGTGLVMGVHGMDQGVHGENSDQTSSGKVHMRMLGAYATYDDDNWEAMTELYAFRNKDMQGGSTHSSNAWYAQVGYNLNEQYTPYARYERSALDESDPYFALQESGKSYRRAVAGLRYNLTPKSALKAEWRRTTEPDIQGTQDSLSIQYSIRF